MAQGKNSSKESEVQIWSVRAQGKGNGQSKVSVLHTFLISQQRGDFFHSTICTHTPHNHGLRIAFLGKAENI